MKRIVIIGGGVWVPQLCEALSAAMTGPLELVLLARRLERLSQIAAQARRQIAAHLNWRVTCTTDRSAALAGADAVLLMARIGGFAARAHDEAFPAEYGIVGDEGLGPGGIANAWRTIPWMIDLAEDLRGVCPEAWVLNLMAPLGITTRALLDANLRAVGLCELPAVTRAALSARGGGAYAGLNHLGWFWDLPDAPGCHPLKYFERVFGEQRPELGRAQTLRALSEQLLTVYAKGEPPAELVSKRPTPWFEHAAVPALSALLGEGAWTGFANLRNGQLLPELPSEHVIEVEALFDVVGVRGISPGPMPPQIVAFLQAVARSESLCYQGARARSKPLIRDAMRALPMAIDDHVAQALCDRATQEIDPCS